MFDYTDRSRHRSSATRWTTTAVSAIGHVVLVIALAIPALYATDTLPTPKDTMAFFVSAAPPPPPPAPPAPVPAAPKTVPPKATRVSPPKPVAQLARVVAAAPIEAPAGITPETGFEGIASSDVAQQAGFEYGVASGVAGGIVGGLESALPPPPPPPAPAPRAPVRVGGEITAPRLSHRVDPVYPLLAQRALVQGVVIVEATVDREGRVEETRVLRSHSLLDDAAVDAVRQWVYEPLMLNGLPQPFVLTVTLSFSLPTER